MIPHRTPFFLPLVYPSLIWRMDAEVRELFLTFDDGPVPGPTEFVLDQLAQAAGRATFFCIGDNIRKHPGVFKRITEAGHSVGNHTMNHLNGWKTSCTDYIANVREFDNIVRAGGYSAGADLFRPPYGRITRQQIKALPDYRIIMWDVLSRDYDRQLSPEQCLRRTIKACRSGSIIVFHDSYKSEKNMKYALPRLIDHFGARGFKFKPLMLPK